jgi:hypothetical protein
VLGLDLSRVGDSLGSAGLVGLPAPGLVLRSAFLGGNRIFRGHLCHRGSLLVFHHFESHIWAGRPKRRMLSTVARRSAGIVASCQSLGPASLYIRLDAAYEESRAA